MRKDQREASIPEGPRRHLHGRRVGRPIRSAQAALLTQKLPEFRIDLSQSPPDDLRDLFFGPVEDIWLEIGFGAGEHLLWQAQQHPGTGFIGCEPFINGVVKVLRGVEQCRLQNLRLFDDDARLLLDWLPLRCCARIYILFPDPWPKKRHRKRRLLTGEGLQLIARAMRSGAELRFATDIADYAEMVLENIAVSPDFGERPGLLPERPVDWPLTRYAEKAIAAGRNCQFFIFERL